MATLDDNGAAALMAAYCDGDERAFAALYQRVAPKLMRFFCCRTGDNARADDLVQQTFFKLHRARAVYVRGADPLPWIFTIAHRVLVDERRARARAPLATTEEPAVTPPVTDRWLRDALAEAIDRLPGRCREAVRLAFVEGLTHAEAAERLGTTAGAVKLRAHRGRQALRLRLAELV
jgi:RNA polymerase sigma-70 factor, ECF subfamily